MTSILFILFIILVVAAVVWFGFSFNRYRTAVQELCFRLDRESDPETYFEIQKKLRSLRLTLIPFVNEKNVESVYSFFYRDASANRAEKTPRTDSLITLLAPSVIATVLCLGVLGGTTYAWFSGSESAKGKISTPSVTAEVVAHVNTAEGEEFPANENTEFSWKYEIPAKADEGDNTVYVFILKVDSAAQNLYYTVETESETYRTPNITAYDQPFTFQVPKKTDAQTVTLRIAWTPSSPYALLTAGDPLP